IVLGVADVALVVGPRDVALGDGTSAAVVVAAVAAIVPIVAVGILAARGGASAPVAAVAWALALLVPVSQAQRPTFGLSAARWLDLAAVAVPAVVLAATLAGARTDRLRRLAAGARADEILAGRAEIASMIAHEVRGPVTTIKGLAATTSGSYDRLSDDERRDFVGLIENEAARLLDVVDQTALALRLDAGTVSFQRRAEELAPIVAEAVDRAPTDPHPVALDLAEGVVANVDRRWLGNAIGQGVSNAARFSPPDAPIDVRLRVEGGHAVIDILDRGPGVPAERRDEVFGRFVRWRPPGYEDRQGSGLGLFICRALLAEHAGDASIGITAEGGTMLRLRLPTEGSGGG
ncbi:MAG TPA: HAMP domain-containing sensor histidine kinase, partial [Actinomycetota bacterium]